MFLNWDRNSFASQWNLQYPSSPDLPSRSHHISLESIYPICFPLPTKNIVELSMCIKKIKKQKEGFPIDRSTYQSFYKVCCRNVCYGSFCEWHLGDTTWFMYPYQYQFPLAVAQSYLLNANTQPCKSNKYMVKTKAYGTN